MSLSPVLKVTMPFPSISYVRWVAFRVAKRHFGKTTYYSMTSDSSVSVPASSSLNSPSDKDAVGYSDQTPRENSGEYPGMLSLVDRRYYTSRSHLIEWISRNVIHEDEMLLAVNKLSGTSVFGKRIVFGNTQLLPKNSEQNEDGKRPVTIVSILPELREIYKCSELDIALGNPRFHSGVVILSKSKKIKKRLEKCVVAAQSQKQTYLKYVLITNGFPLSLKESPEEMSFMCEKIGERVLSVRVHQSSTSARKRGEEILTVFNTTPIVTSGQTASSLLQVAVNKAKWDCIEVYMTEKLSSVLGDHLYSGRVSTVLGMPVHVEPHLVKPGIQKLPHIMKMRLGIHDDDLHHLPLHLHRHQVELNRFPSKQSSPLVIRAPLPDYFKATMHKLKLQPHSCWNL